MLGSEGRHHYASLFPTLVVLSIANAFFSSLPSTAEEFLLFQEGWGVRSHSITSLLQVENDTVLLLLLLLFQELAV